MNENKTTALYFHLPTNWEKGIIDYNSIEAYSLSLEGVVEVWDSENNTISNDSYFLESISQKNISRIIIVGHIPGLYKSFFSKILRSLGKDPTEVYEIRFAEYGIRNKVDTKSAKALITSALRKPTFASKNSRKVKLESKDTLVIGGGIAGIQASLEIAKSGNKVHLVEKTGSIGGHMAMFDKTFPTLDCAACILTPKMVDVGQNADITIHSLTEVIDVSGEAGNFIVTLKKYARRVDETKCIGCGTCSEKCPGTALSEFDAGTTLRKAIFMPFPQAVPNKYLVDHNSCIYVQKGKCRACEKVCPVENCINLDEKDTELQLNVGNIIITTGFNVFDPSQIKQYGYGEFPNVITSLELERLVNASGPTLGHIRNREQDKKGNWIFAKNNGLPKKFAIIHCIGSRDENHNKYCSRVCCMYSLKLAHLIKEKMPKAEVYEYFIDMRAFGKGYDEFYDRVRGEGIRLVRGKVGRIEERNGHLLIRSEDIENDQILEVSVDMVILSVGLQPSKNTRKIADLFNIEVTSNGWFKEIDSLTGSVETNRPGIYIAGVAQGPKDIPDSVVQASAAASKVLQSIINESIQIRTSSIDSDDDTLVQDEISPLVHM
jgi:heterodisulfide reductase subunit A2